MENGKYFESCNFSLKFNICQSYESQTLGLVFLQDYPSPTFFFMSCQVIPGHLDQYPAQEALLFVATKELLVKNVQASIMTSTQKRPQKRLLSSSLFLH